MGSSLKYPSFSVSLTDRQTAIAVYFFAVLFLGIFCVTYLPVKDDFNKYQLAADNYINGNLSSERQLDFSPLYLSLHIFFRSHFSQPDVFITVIQVLLTATTALLLFLSLAKYVGTAFSVLGALLFLGNKSVILYTFTYEPEAFMIFFLVGLVYFTLQNTPRSCVLSGAILALSILTRPTFAPFIFLIPLYYILKFGRRGLRPVGHFLLPLIVILALFVANRGTLVPMSPGQVFFEGNNPNSYGESAAYPPLVRDYALQFPGEPDVDHVIYKDLARRTQGEALSVRQANWFWTGKALNFMMDHPGHFLKRVLIKLQLIFHSYRRHDMNNLFYNDYQALGKVPTVPFALISVLGLFGIILCARRWMEFLPLFAVTFWQILLMTVLYVSDRQRVVLISMMTFFAIYFLQFLWTTYRPSKKKKKKKKRPFFKEALVGVVFLLLLFSLHDKNSIMKDEIHLKRSYAHTNHYLDEAFRLRKEGNLKEAADVNVLSLAYTPFVGEQLRLAQLNYEERSFKRRALDQASQMIHVLGRDHPSAAFDFGLLLLENDYLAQSKRIFEVLRKEELVFSRSHSHSSLPEFYLARVHEEKGEWEKAEAVLSQAIQKNPGDPWVLSHLYVLTGETEHKERLIRYFGLLDASFLIGKAYYENEQYTAALSYFRFVCEKIPTYRKGRIYLSLCLGALGKLEEATKNYVVAVKINQDFLIEEEKILRIVETFAQENPQNPQAQFSLDVVKRQMGLL